MAHILLAQNEPAIRSLLDAVLGAEGHDVTAVSDGWDMHIVLRATLHPLVVVYYTTLLGACGAPRDGEPPEMVWECCLREVDDLRRHRFIETRSWTDPPPPTMQPLYDELGIVIVPMPFDVQTLVQTVDEAARQLA
jgi:hypothetical protein